MENASETDSLHILTYHFKEKSRANVTEAELWNGHHNYLQKQSISI